MNNCFICGKPRGGVNPETGRPNKTTRKYTCADKVCERNWGGYVHDLKVLDNTLAYQRRQFGPKAAGDPVNPWVAWAESKYEESVARLRAEWHVHQNAPVRA